MLSKGSLQCDRSAYGLYSGFGGGMAFYVSSQAQYTISPEVSSAIVWDGAWHHVIGSYDGDRVRLWIDGSQVGAGTPVSMAIAYTSGSKGIYIGTYRGSCDLGFHGAIDDVAVWDDRPAEATTGPVIDPVPDTPTTIAVGGAGGSGAAPGATATLAARLPARDPQPSHDPGAPQDEADGDGASRRTPRGRRAHRRQRQGRHHHGRSDQSQGHDEDRRAGTQGRAPRRSRSAARRPAAPRSPSALAGSRAWQDARMRISARADYAVRAAVELAAAGDGPTKGEAIARAQSIPLKFLENILGDLRHAGLVRSQRGADGGYWLGRPAGEITVADVIRAVEGPLASVRGGPPEDGRLPGRRRAAAAGLDRRPRQPAQRRRARHAGRRRRGPPARARGQTG